jgi:hypothetical protein
MIKSSLSTNWGDFFSTSEASLLPWGLMGKLNKNQEKGCAPHPDKALSLTNFSMMSSRQGFDAG